MPTQLSLSNCPTVGQQQSFESQYLAYKELTKEGISSYLASFPKDHPMCGSLNYTISTEGKLFRPVFSLAVGDYLGLDLAALSKVSLLLELIHVSSLIHDDLPALDNDDLRRGKPSCHKVYGEGHSILLGDFLIAEAYSIVANNMAEGGIVRKLVSAIGSAYSDLCLGQVLDLELRGKNLEQSEALIELERINALKTGALFELSVRIPLIISGADEKIVYVIEEYSRNLGLLFQLSDDILDASSDVKAGKEKEINYIDVLGVIGTEARAEELVQSTIHNLNSLHDSANGFLHQCVHFARGRKD